MQRFFHLTLLMLVALSAAAYNITGKVADRNGEPLVSASVRLLSAGDSTLVKGSVTDSKGYFTFPGVSGKFIVETSYVGFTTDFRNVSSAKEAKLGTITLDESSILLKETTVVGIKTPITVKEDTIEFNADSYHVRPNAVVEDLIKRLPGAEVSSEGKITVNGQEVKKILVDGKEFFSDDPTVASRILPGEMVDRLQVVNRKSDLARLTGVDDGEDETVINLTVKKGMQNGWFGNVEAGYGTDSRYKGNFMINRFWNGNQITFIGNANNTNDLRFTDGGGRFRRFGGNRGITESQSFGVNFNVGKDEILRLGGNVLYSHSDRFTTRSSEREYLFTDSSSYYSSGSRSTDIGNNVRADFRLQWKPNEYNTLDFRPNFSYNHNHSWSTDSSFTRAGDAMRSDVTKSLNTGDATGESWEFGGRLIYNHNFKEHKGRSFSVNADYRFSNVQEYENTYSWNRFFLMNDSIDLYDQFADNHTWTNNLSTRLSWTEPLGDAANGNFLTFAYRLQYKWNNADKLTYDSLYDPMVQVDSLSNSFRNDYMNQDVRAGFKHVSKKVTVDVGLSLVPQRSKSIDLINSARNIPERWVWNFAPYLRYRWKASQTKALQVDYMGRSSQPSMSQLQPVADMSDPLNIVQGNPDLKPSFTHNLRLRFHNFSPEAQRSIMTMVNARVAQNSIISKTEYDKTTGGRTTTYTNVNGIWSVQAMNMVSFPLKNKSFTFNNHLMFSYSNSVGYNNGLRNRSGSLFVNEMLGFAWRPENFELEIRPRYGLQNVTNTVQTGANQTVHTYGGTLYASYSAPFGLVLNTEFGYLETSGYSAGYDEKRWSWDASISYEFLNDRSLSVSLNAYDLLNQNSSISRSVTANYIEDSMANTLGRYCMLTVAYKFNTFKGGDMPTNRNRRGHHGPPPGHGRGRPRH